MSPLPPTTDLLIAGGGITGASIARDAAMRGLSVVLVERADFASGDQQPFLSRLVHGGLRYLAQGHVGLVREASVEKMRLARIAPHLCDPLRFLFPVWRGDPRPLWQLSIGVRLYDLLCGSHNLGRSASHRPQELDKMAPGIRPQELRGAVSYFDGFTNDARLVLDTLLAAQRAGASLRNYTRLVSAEAGGSGTWDCTLLDASGAQQTLRARAIANATGAWAQSFPQSSVRLRLTKGVHLVIDRARLPVQTAVVLTQGERILFVIPWGDRVILGTTDTDYAGDPAEVRTDTRDVRYILDVVNHGFPSARIAPAEVIATWAGIRPLIAPHKARAGAPSEVSRQHEIRMPQPGWFDIAGGKLTTARFMAEQAVDRIGTHLGGTPTASVTASTPLVSEADARYSGVLPPPLQPDVVRHACETHWARHLDDVLLRRTSWHYYHGPTIAEEASYWMAQARGWTDAERVAELDRFRDLTAA